MIREFRGDPCTVRSLENTLSLLSPLPRMDSESLSDLGNHLNLKMFACLFVYLFCSCVCIFCCVCVFVCRSYVVGNSIGDITRCDLRTGTEKLLSFHESTATVTSSDWTYLHLIKIHLLTR